VRKLLAGISIGLATAAVVLLLGYTGWLETLELKSYDWRMRTIADLRASSGEPRRLVHPDIVLVEINDLSLQELAPLVGRWPWPRALMGLLVDYVNRGKPKTIVLDIGYWEPERESTYDFLGQPFSSAKSDQALADAVQRAGNVVLLADATAPGREDGENKEASWNAPPYRLGPAIEQRPLITPPIPALAAAASGLGHNFLVLDPDGPARRIAPFVRQGDRYLPTLGVAAVLRAENIRPDEVVLEGNAIALRNVRIPLVPIEVQDVASGGGRLQYSMMINYRAPVLVKGQRPFPSYEVRHLLKSAGQIIEGSTPDIDPAVFTDKIVFVGLTGAGLLDQFQTPLGRGTLPGIQLHASVADTILSNRFIRRASTWIAPATIAAGALVVGLIAAMLPFSAAAAGAVLLAVAYAGFATYGFSEGLWLSFAGPIGLWLVLAHPMLSVGLALFLGTAYRYFVEDAEKRKVSRLFGRYVSKDVYNQLMANPGLAELGGQRREMTVLFSDIRGFTSITEKGSPEELVAQLNQYFSRMVEVVFRHGGTVDKFVGDMVMALFGAPVVDQHHADHAVAAAVEMVDQLRQLNAEWTSQGKATLDIGIGLNSGDMIAGNIGSSSIMSYTVIGDNVNLGSRLESLNKEYGTRIIISDATRTRLTTEYTTRPLGSVIVKGKTKPVDIFEISVPSPLPPSATAAAAAEGTTT
jgi:adenylate cyclase